MTADEYEDSIWDLACFMEQLEDDLDLPAHQPWLLSMDNDSTHAAADLAGLGIWPAERRFPLPALSPDMHKAVEHVHGWLCAKMQKWRRSFFPRKPSNQDVIKHLTELFYSYDPVAIQKDIDSLPETYKAIIHAAGMYPPKPFR